MRLVWLPAAAAMMTLTAPAMARDSLGVFETWAAFRDPASGGAGPRCYAIAEPETASGPGHYATIAFWPRARVRAQFNARFPRAISLRHSVTLTLGGRRFALVVRGHSAWARDARMDAAIVAAMRSATAMSVAASDDAGRRMAASWPLRGAATAIDAAALGCARR